MLAFFLRRLLNAAGVMLAVAFLAFLIFRFVGDPVELMLNEQATQAQRDELRDTARARQAASLAQFVDLRRQCRCAAISASPTAISRRSSR